MNIVNLIENGEYVLEKSGVRVYSTSDKKGNTKREADRVKINSGQEYIIFLDYDKKQKYPVAVPVLWKMSQRFIPKHFEKPSENPIYFEYSELGPYLRRIQVNSSEVRALVLKLIDKVKKTKIRGILKEKKIGDN